MLYQVVIGSGPDPQIFYIDAYDQTTVFDHIREYHMPASKALKITVLCLAGQIEKAGEKNKQEAGDE